MRPTSDLIGLYRSFPAYLWVEDEETRTYLEAVWTGESLIKILVAGGHGHIHAVVNAARNDWNAHVFGFRDRDFGESNQDRWTDPSVTVMTASVVEIENYLLLDSEPIAACDVNTKGLSAAQVDAALHELATPLTWWMSCRHTITKIRDDIMRNFIEHPSREKVRSQKDAEDAILASAWWKEVLPAFQPKWPGQAAITASLVKHQADYQAMLQSGDWRREFSGKEILRDLTARIWTERRPPDPEGRLGLIQAIGKEQLKRRQVPREIEQLRLAIRRRIGR